MEDRENKLEQQREVEEKEAQKLHSCRRGSTPQHVLRSGSSHCSVEAEDAAKAESTGSDVSPLANEFVSADREVTAAKVVRDKEAKDFSKYEVFW